MPRARIKPLPMPIACSPALLADLLDIRADDVARGIELGALIPYRVGMRRRILVADAVAWVKKWPHSKPKNRGVPDHD
jgi:hypothetical protein